MKVIILAGGLGTRLPEYTKKIPKPMVKVAGYPIIVHLMKHYIISGFKEFFLATGYKSKEFKKYFKNYKKKMENLSKQLYLIKNVKLRFLILV